VSGPLAGVCGVLRQFKNERRIVVSVDTIMKSIAIEVASSQIARDYEGRLFKNV
jgi:molybdopterin-guanine dinucleotide biosynthesis protein A